MVFLAFSLFVKLQYITATVIITSGVFMYNQNPHSKETSILSTLNHLHILHFNDNIVLPLLLVSPQLPVIPRHRIPPNHRILSETWTVPPPLHYAASPPSLRKRNSHRRKKCMCKKMSSGRLLGEGRRKMCSGF